MKGNLLPQIETRRFCCGLVLAIVGVVLVSAGRRILGFIVFALAALGGGWWLEQQRSAARVEQERELERAIRYEPVEQPAQ